MKIYLHMKMPFMYENQLLYERISSQKHFYFLSRSGRHKHGIKIYIIIEINIHMSVHVFHTKKN